MLSTTVEFESQWMVFDLTNQEWTVFPTELSFVLNCCSGHLVTVRGGFHYFFTNWIMRIKVQSIESMKMELPSI